MCGHIKPAYAFWVDWYDLLSVWKTFTLWSLLKRVLRSLSRGLFLRCVCVLWETTPDVTEDPWHLCYHGCWFWSWWCSFILCVDPKSKIDLLSVLFLPLIYLVKISTNRKINKNLWGALLLPYGKHPVFQLHSCSLFTFIAYDYHKYRISCKRKFTA